VQSVLEDQLLGDVVRTERPEIEERRTRLVLSIAADRKQLKEFEDKILRTLSESSVRV
jgi:dynein heavy chain